MDFTFMRLTAIRLLAISGVGLSTAYGAVIVTPLSNTSPASAAALVNSLLSSTPNLSIVAGSALYSGQATASGTFANGGTGPTGVGLDSGVLLTTGDARFLSSSALFAGDDPNKDGGFTAGVGNSLTPNNAPGNARFNSLTPESTFNASILTFSFVPQGSTLTLQLVFASEDYNDLVNSGFPTDVFGVFLNGVNYAWVPGTLTPISASSINCGGPTNLPAPNVGGQNCGLYRDNAPFSGSISSEIDGFTVPISLSIPVNFGVPNTITIGIADTFDSAGDSALLLAGGSLSVRESAAVPEPSTVALMLVGILGMAHFTRRRGKGASRSNMRLPPASVSAT